MKHGFVHFHSWGSGPFDAFCSGSLDVKRIENVDDAIDLRDRCQSMLEIIGYDEDPPVSKVNDVNITEIREWSIIPATHRGFDSGASMGGSIAIANAETRKKAVELARAKMDEAQKKFQYLKDIMETADKEEKEKETVDA
jgi:hypothetical protein